MYMYHNSALCHVCHICCDFRTLKNKWQDRSASISTLEEQVTHMRDVWVEKERKITDERDKAVTAAE